MPRRVVQTDLPAQPDEAVPDLLDEPAADVDEATEDAGERRPPTNGDLARIFHEMGDILEVKGEIKFKTVAYHRAADAIARAPFDVAAAYAAGDRRPIPGVGPGDRRQDRRARDDRPHGVPTSVSARRSRPASSTCCGSRASGRRRCASSTRASASESLEDLRQAAEAGTLRGLKGISASTEQRILEGIEQLESRPRRLLLNRAQAISDDLVRAARWHARRRADRAGRVAPPAQGDHRRPRPARRDRRPGRRRRPVHGSRAGRPGHRRAAARRAASG